MAQLLSPLNHNMESNAIVQTKMLKFLFFGNKGETKVKVKSGHFSCFDSIQEEEI